MSEMTPARNFRELKIWQKGHSLVLGIYTLTSAFPKHELFGLTSQMRRAAVSIPANIAEGFGRRGKSDKARCLNIAAASLEELADRGAVKDAFQLRTHYPCVARIMRTICLTSAFWLLASGFWLLASSF